MGKVKRWTGNDEGMEKGNDKTGREKENGGGKMKKRKRKQREKLRRMGI